MRESAAKATADTDPYASLLWCPDYASASILDFSERRSFAGFRAYLAHAAAMRMQHKVLMERAELD